jgi:hypothetical protein
MPTEIFPPRTNGASFESGLVKIENLSRTDLACVFAVRNLRLRFGVITLTLRFETFNVTLLQCVGGDLPPANAWNRGPQ